MADLEYQYARTLTRIQSLGRFGVRFGLERITEALERLGRPQERFPAVHIAGTNGKGSTAAMVESCLRAAGVHAGLFTSPHLCRFTERIRVDGQEIGKRDVVRLAEQALAEGLTFFEVVTAMAICAFAEQGVDLAVMETGMGGRLDATNVVRPVVCVLTHVGLDHTEVLGPDLATVATEKAGIFKPGVPVVSAPPPSPEVEDVVRRRCAELEAPLYIMDRDFRLEVDGEDSVFRMDDWTLRGFTPALPGTHQRQNAALCLAALGCLRRRGWRLEDDHVRRGLADVRWPGRLEWVDDQHLLDGAHNPDGAEALARELSSSGRRFCLVLGTNGPRDAAPLVEPLLALADQVVFTRPRSDRALDPEQLARMFPGAVAAPDLAAALALARADLPRLITGSLYLVGEARALLAGEPVDPVATADPR